MLPKRHSLLPATSSISAKTIKLPRSSTPANSSICSAPARSEDRGRLDCTLALLFLALRRHRFHRGFHLFRVAQVVAVERLQVLIELVDQWHAGGNVEIDNLFLGNVVEVLDQRTEAVAVRDDQHLLTSANGRSDGLAPERQEARDGVLEALRQRQFGRGEMAVPRVAAGEARVVGGERGRRNVIAAAPHFHLGLAELRGGLGFVEALQRAVVALVEPP